MNNLFEFYEVGGHVRDELLGIKSKDVDFVAVPSMELLHKTVDVTEMFTNLVNYLTVEKFEIFLITESCFTIRAKFPKGHKYEGVADFVMARKELRYYEGTRKPIIVPGTLYDDLARRDFTINAIAKDENGEIIDPFNGQQSLKQKYLITPLDPEITMNDDPLRILRAIRFAITKNMWIHYSIREVINDFDYNKKMPVVSTERIVDELTKCFKHSTLKTIDVLGDFPELREYIFSIPNLWLMPTLRDK